MDDNTEEWEVAILVESFVCIIIQKLSKWILLHFFLSAFSFYFIPFIFQLTPSVILSYFVFIVLFFFFVVLVRTKYIEWQTPGMKSVYVFILLLIYLCMCFDFDHLIVKSTKFIFLSELRRSIDAYRLLFHFFFFIFVFISWWKKIAAQAKCTLIFSVLKWAVDLSYSSTFKLFIYRISVYYCIFYKQFLFFSFDLAITMFVITDDYSFIRQNEKKRA